MAELNIFADFVQLECLDKQPFFSAFTAAGVRFRDAVSARGGRSAGPDAAAADSS